MGADCGSDHELFIAKFRLKLKNIGKTTKPFRYDLNKIPYDYTVEVTNRFNRLDLIDRGPEEQWMEVYNIIQEAVIKTWRRQWQPTPVLLPGKSHGWRSLLGCSPCGSTESDTTEAT